MQCLHCTIGKFHPPQNGQEWHLVCDVCSAIKLTYEPMPHQRAFHEDTHKFKMFAGGYGSAKTTTACAEIIKHVLETPRGTTLIGAATNPQLEQTAEKQFFEMFPQELITHRSIQKKYIDTVNGHRVIFRPLDQEGKARSLNLSAFWIEEASEVDYDYFVQLTTRLRSRATTNHLGILSTNPDLNWVRSEILLKSHVIHNAQDNYVQDESQINPSISTHIAPTELNIYLPPSYYEDTARGKPDWWVRRFLKGSFSHAEGQVYPQLQDNIVPAFTIPKHWEKMQATDFGLRTPTAALWGAIDPETGIVYIYDEHYEAGRPINYHAEKMHERLDDIPFGRLRFLVGDPAGRNKTAQDERSTFEHYAEYGVYFEPATNKIEDGVMKVFSYFEMGKLKIFDTCVNTIQEGLNYKYPSQSLASNKDVSEIPVAKDDHTMDCLKYMIAELPDNPLDLVTEVPQGRMEDSLPYALQDEPTHYAQDWSSYY